MIVTESSIGNACIIIGMLNQTLNGNGTNCGSSSCMICRECFYLAQAHLRKNVEVFILAEYILCEERADNEAISLKVEQVFVLSQSVRK